jgi:hypothetical protein
VLKSVKSVTRRCRLSLLGSGPPVTKQSNFHHFFFKQIYQVVGLQLSMPFEKEGFLHAMQRQVVSLSIYIDIYRYIQHMYNRMCIYTDL